MISNFKVLDKNCIYKGPYGVLLQTTLGISWCNVTSWRTRTYFTRTMITSANTKKKINRQKVSNTVNTCKVKTKDILTWHYFLKFALNSNATFFFFLYISWFHSPKQLFKYHLRIHNSYGYCFSFNNAQTRFLRYLEKYVFLNGSYTFSWNRKLPENIALY